MTHHSDLIRKQPGWAYRNDRWPQHMHSTGTAHAQHRHITGTSSNGTDTAQHTAQTQHMHSTTRHGMATDLIVEQPGVRRATVACGVVLVREDPGAENTLELGVVQYESEPSP